MNEIEYPYFDIRKNSKTLIFDLIGLWSYPIFVYSNDGKILWMYLISKTETDNRLRKSIIFRPFASLITYPNSSEVLGYQNFSFSHDPFPKYDWKKPIGYFPHNPIGNLTVAEFKKLENNLIKHCVCNTSYFEKGHVISEEFKKLYSQLSNPCFKKFVQCLAPKFYELVYC